MRADKDGLRAQVDELLRRRPGWKLQAMATPGLPPAWCYGSGGQAELSVATDGGSIRIYVVEKDIDVTVGKRTFKIWQAAQSDGDAAMLEDLTGLVENMARRWKAEIARTPSGGEIGDRDRNPSTAFNGRPKRNEG